MPVEETDSAGNLRSGPRRGGDRKVDTENGIVLNDSGTPTAATSRSDGNLRRGVATSHDFMAVTT